MHVVDRDHADEVGGTAVVVDVLRAFTTASLACALGADHVLLAAGTQEAFALRDQLDGDALLVGEDGGLPIPGFDLSNSPVEVVGADVVGRVLVHRTTSGTRAAITAARHAERVVCTALLSAHATARLLGGTAPSYVVSGRAADKPGDDGDDDLAVAEHVEALRTGTAPPSDTRARIRASAAAAHLRDLGLDEADVRLATSALVGPALVATSTPLGPRLDPVDPVAPTWPA